ncbi:MAG: PD-(D/E)XK nuclease family protein [Proteobacteria bacterium]|nr:PD-(D/E)XK nuclease family protein [Pseudomonadota bacterium]
MKPEIKEFIDKGFSLLTASNRLAHYLQHQYADCQLQAGKLAWQTVEILPWNAWLSRLWQEYADTFNNEQLLLSSQQQQLVWQQLVDDSKYKLLNPVSVARKAVETWNLCQRWQIPIFPSDIYLNEDARAFQSWANGYRQRCQAQAWIDGAGIASVLANNIQQQRLSIDKKILLIGFDEIEPQQMALFEVLRSAGCEIQEHVSEHVNQHVSSRGYLDERAEINAVADWVRQLLESGENKTIGIVVPNLHALRNQIEDSLDDVLFPAAILLPTEPMQRPYSISLGQPLSSYPLIDTALAILCLANENILLEEFGGLLRTPFIKGAKQEQHSRAKLDARLRDFGETQLDIDCLLYFAGHTLQQDQQCTEFLDCLRTWQDTFKALPVKQTARQWTSTFSQLLEIFAWPGERSLNSAEFQMFEAWQDVIKQFASLQLVTASFSFSFALSQLKQLAGAYSFQPQTPEVPVQVLGLAGAAGLGFDHLWVMGLHEEVWPIPAEPNPFIPIGLQRQAQLANASAEINLAHSKRMTELLRACSAEVIFSYPQHEQERPLRPSPLIKPYPPASTDAEKHRHTSYARQIHATRDYQYINDFRGPVIAKGESVKGGAGLFKDQAACAFRAFARYRLSAYGLGSVDIGLNAMERGSLIHTVMQLMWQHLGGQQALLACDEALLESLIDKSINVAIEQYQKRRPQTFTERFKALEAQRLARLVHDWLALERERQTFEVIAREEKHHFSFHGIEVRTRIDRIDQIHDGRKVIIDYKTGDARLAAWFGERPDEPQLPLYAVTNEGQIAAIVFARLKRGECSYVGLANGEDIIPGVSSWQDSRYNRDSTKWELLLAQWDEVLKKLANAFCDGDARVAPKDINSCRYCDLHALCRIYERGQTDGLLYKHGKHEGNRGMKNENI